MFTGEQILEEFADAQWLGRRPHLMQVMAYEAARKRGPEQASFVRSVPTYTIEPHSIQRLVCPQCVTTVEVRRGSNRVVHSAGVRCTNWSLRGWLGSVAK